MLAIRLRNLDRNFSGYFDSKFRLIPFRNSEFRHRNSKMRNFECYLNRIQISFPGSISFAKLFLCRFLDFPHNFLQNSGPNFIFLKNWRKNFCHLAIIFQRAKVWRHIDSSQLIACILLESLDCCLPDKQCRKNIKWKTLSGFT